MKTFQRPLSSEEEASYIQLLKEGEGKAVSEAREILIERNLRLVAHIAKKYQNVDEDMEDLPSNVFIILYFLSICVMPYGTYFFNSTNWSLYNYL